jgi:hypothetical protein
MGAGATIWSRGAADQLALHEDARREYLSAPDLEKWERLHSTALMLVIAVDQVLTFARRVEQLTDDARLKDARTAFGRVCADAEALRDLIAHLDEYAVGTGWRQQGRKLPPINAKNVQSWMYWQEGETVLNIGNEQLNLRQATDAAIDLARVVETVRSEHQQRVEDEANDALRARYGRPAPT